MMTQQHDAATCLSCANERQNREFNCGLHQQRLQPHEVAFVSKGFTVTAETKTQRVTCYLTVYEMSRHFGGREEGGWWYDAYEFTGASFPFEAEQDYEATVVEASSTTYVEWYDEQTNEPMAWVPVGYPRVTNESTRVLVNSVRMHFISMFGEPDTQNRFSCAQREPDFAFVYELNPGERANRPRPRYE